MELLIAYGGHAALAFVAALGWMRAMRAEERAARLDRELADLCRKALDVIEARVDVHDHGRRALPAPSEDDAEPPASLPRARVIRRWLPS